MIHIKTLEVPGLGEFIAPIVQPAEAYDQALHLTSVLNYRRCNKQWSDEFLGYSLTTRQKVFAVFSLQKRFVLEFWVLPDSSNCFEDITDFAEGCALAVEKHPVHKTSTDTSILLVLHDRFADYRILLEASKWYAYLHSDGLPIGEPYYVAEKLVQFAAEFDKVDISL